MLTIETRTSIEGLTGREVFDFLANPSDREYQRWWPGVHLAFHTLTRADGHVGDRVLMDEYVGARRVRLAGFVLEAEPGKRLVWQFQAGIRLPVWLSLDLADAGDGVSITHRIRAGWAGFGRVFDPLLRLYFTRGFATAMDQHVRTEFQRLRDRLHPTPAAPRSAGPSADDDRRSPAPGPLR